ncbi:MAG: YjaG family protein [Kangiellaceae bacterium]|nr:YjaG family protein [Kangiellaceae bacterium]MCW8998098.1 YjaG family protein [Kangiellaceae bacterium]MCW9015930.1 YjaG family protein [Kangiellaceae bacterium]
MNNQNQHSLQYNRLIKQLETLELEPQQKLLFATCLIQRMLPNYRVFSENSDFGEHSVLSNMVDLFWQKAAGLPVKINVDNQILKLMDQAPDKSRYDIYAVNPAIDLCTGIECVLLSLDDKQIDTAEEISLLSRSCVASYIEYLNSLDNVEPPVSLANDSSSDLDSNICEDPLFQWEVETQLELLNCISEEKSHRNLSKQLKQDILAQGLSNLGIEC